MSDKQLATRDEIERFKPFVEIVKYAISISIALAAVCGVIIRLSYNGLPQSDSPTLLFALGVGLNVIFFLVCHRVASEAMRGMTHQLTVTDRENALSNINSSSYSRFVICFVFLLMYWSIAIGWSSLSPVQAKISIAGAAHNVEVTRIPVPVSTPPLPPDCSSEPAG